MGRARKSVATAFAFFGVDETGMAQLGQDMVEELFRNRIGSGDIRDLSKFVRRQSGQMDHGLEAILPLFGKHNLILSLAYPKLRRRNPVRSMEAPAGQPSIATIHDTHGEHDEKARTTPAVELSLRHSSRANTSRRSSWQAAEKTMEPRPPELVYTTFEPVSLSPKWKTAC
jgi:hypothetical protein